VHKNLRQVKDSLLGISCYEEKIAFLKNKFTGSDCYLLAPGPSLGQVDKKLLNEKLKNNLVFCIKQAFLEYGKYTDFHFINDCNLPNPNGYLYNVRKEPIIVASSGYYEPEAKSRFGNFQRWDIFCRVLDPLVYPDNNMGYVLQNLDFSKGLFNNSCLRPCGPSITVETVIYMAVHLGIKNIYAIGWDTGEKVGEHFYKEETYLSDSRNFEYKMVQNGSGPLYNWLKEHGVNLHLISNVSSLSKEIPRIRLEDV